MSETRIVAGNHTIVISEYPDGKIRSIIADGTHWVSVSTANMQEQIGINRALRECLEKSDSAFQDQD